MAHVGGTLPWIERIPKRESSGKSSQRISRENPRYIIRENHQGDSQLVIWGKISRRNLMVNFFYGESQVDQLRNIIHTQNYLGEFIVRSPRVSTLRTFRENPQQDHHWEIKSSQRILSENSHQVISVKSSQRIFTVNPNRSRQGDLIILKLIFRETPWRIK